MSERMSTAVLKQQNKKKAGQPKRIAIYVIYDKDGILDNYRVYYLKELRKVTDTIVAIVSGTLTPESRDQLETLVDDICVRENKGLLAGSWIDGIKHIGWNELDNYDELLMLNDSFFGPFFPLSEMFDTMEKSNADFYGAIKNFEEKSYHEIAGRKLKHGFFRGSICYFYIIRSRLLHSAEFKKYWTMVPDIKEDWDTYFFAEINFFDYVKDCGFRIDAFQGDRLKGYFFDNLSHNMHKLIENERIPFARIRPFCTEMQDQALQIGYGMDPRKTLEYIDNNTDYDINLIWDYILRTKNLSNIWYQLQLEYVVPKFCVEKPFEYTKKIAVILHIFYPDLVDTIANYCLNFSENTDFYITTTEEKTKELIEKEFKKRQLHFVCKTRRNVGVAMSTLWITYADIVTNGEYEYICYFHDKKSPYAQFAMHGEQFARRCYENLFGTKEVVMNIINLFQSNPRLGILGAPRPYHGEYFGVCNRTWSQNYNNTFNLAQKLGLHVDINPHIVPVAPYGDMFWFRSKALKKVIAYGFNYDDFAIEYKPDNTFLHAIERIYGFAAQDSGYYYADVVTSDEARSDLVNYQYIIYSLIDIMLKNQQYPHTLEYAKQIIYYHTASKDQNPSLCYGESRPRIIVKNAIKKRIPKPIWNVCKKTYHLFGGKKWVG